MKKLLHPIFLLGLSSFFLPQVLTAQGPPVVDYSQGKIIGNLPYGQHFYIKGSTHLIGGLKADRVVVSIWKTGRDARKQKKLGYTLPDTTTILNDRANYLVNESSWDAYRSTSKDEFRVYVNSVLRFEKEYLVGVNYYKVFDFVLTDDEKSTILKTVTKKAEDYINTNGQEITEAETSLILKTEIRNQLYRKMYEEGETYFSYENILQNIKPISIELLDELSDNINTVASTKLLIKENKIKIESLEKELANYGKGGVPKDSIIRTLKGNITTIQAQLDRNNKDLPELEASLNEKLRIIKTHIILLQTEYAISNTYEVNVTDVQTIRIGTSFGGGFVGLIPKDVNGERDGWESDAFGYTALKFYLLPVDKRIVEPYMSDRGFINRLSILVGVSRKNEFNYRGQTLEKVWKITPVIGFSYDVNRFITIDAGMTFFKQPSISTLLKENKIRVGPMIGANLDIDLFNRFNSLVTDGKYNINPSSN